MHCDGSYRLCFMLLLARAELAAAMHHHCGSTTAEQAIRPYQQFVEGIQGNVSDKNTCSEGKRVSSKEGEGTCSGLVAGPLQQQDWPLGMECAEAHVALGSLLLQQAGDAATLLSSGGNGSGSSGNGSCGNTLGGEDGAASDACDSQKTADGATRSAATLDVVQATAAETTKQAQADTAANVATDATTAAPGVTDTTVTMAGGEALKHYRCAALILQCLKSHPRSHTLFIQALAGASRCHTALGQYAAAGALALEGLSLCAGKPPALNHSAGTGAKHPAAMAAAVPVASSCVGSSHGGAAGTCRGSSGRGLCSNWGGWGGWGQDGCSAVTCLLALAQQRSAAGHPAEACAALEAAARQQLLLLPSHDPQVMRVSCISTCSTPLRQLVLAPPEPKQLCCHLLCGHATLDCYHWRLGNCCVVT